MKNWISAVELLERKNSVFIIPVYQRDYVWTDTQVKQLLDDLLEIIKTERNHFLGIIMDFKEKEKNISKYIVIDGQQRLITLFLIFYALRKRANREHDEVMEKIIDDMLTNKTSNENLKMKLKPLARDERVYQMIAADDTSLSQEQRATKINKAYSLIKVIIGKEWREYGYDINMIYDALKKLKILEVPLGTDDDLQQIFESINATGLPLSLVDLIRNYIIMKENSNNEIWQTIENLFTEQKDLENFFRVFLINKNRKFINKKNIYIEFKKWLEKQLFDNPGSNVRTILLTIKEYAEYYSEIYLKDLSEIDNNIREIIEEHRKIKSDMPAPFILEIYSLLKEEQIEYTDFNKIVLLINSFMVRRAILGLSTSAISKFFPQLLSNVMNQCDDSYSNILEDFEMYFINNNKNKSSRMPTDLELKENLKETNVYIYKDALHCFFDKLENINNPDPRDTMKFEIEHLMPQSNTKWFQMLNVSEDEYLKQINRLGNLTIITKKDNIANSNNLFEYKQEILKNSNHLRINVPLFELKKWDIEEIDKRTNCLIDKFIELYPYRLSNSTAIPENSSPRRLPGIKDLVEWGLVKVNDKLMIKNYLNSIATFIEGNMVEYNGIKMSLNEWGREVTGWKAIQIYAWACKVGEKETLDEKRTKYMREKGLL
jgi:uncharacterized protein with ParB-like and HNH nuclease domain